jgi:hypothetical protein
MGAFLIFGTIIGLPPNYSQICCLDAKSNSYMPKCCFLPKTWNAPLFYVGWNLDGDEQAVHDLYPDSIIIFKYHFTG